MKKTLNYLALMIFEITARLKNVHIDKPNEKNSSLKNYFLSSSIIDGENFVFYILTVDFVILCKLIGIDVHFFILLICSGVLAYGITYLTLEKNEYFRNVFLIHQKNNPSKNKVPMYFLATSIFVIIPVLLLLIKYVR